MRDDGWLAKRINYICPRKQEIPDRLNNAIVYGMPKSKGGDTLGTVLEVSDNP